ncbi:MAG: phospholipase, patatin family [Paenibacillaceae bacterium]|jgi:predicted patatin/cPLA2 family phospholipase|nr:phospholipase, patatin family [Paenibacillaceae bacterium]
MGQVGLVLEGGGMRGVYTGGVLECFLEHGIHIPYVVGVSAGACNAASYVSRQKGRNKRVTIDYVTHPRYVSLGNLFREGSIFGWKLIFDEIPNKLVPFDFDMFYQAPGQLWVGMTDAVTGETLYVEKSETRHRGNILAMIQASSSLPFVSKPVREDGRVLFDGGITAPIPLSKSIADGNSRHIVISTKPEGYRKTPFKHTWLAKGAYGRYPGLVDALARRYRVYNDSLEQAEEMEKQGHVILIRPTSVIEVGRMTKDKPRLEELYELGYRDAQAQLARVRAWLQQDVSHAGEGGTEVISTSEAI